MSRPTTINLTPTDLKALLGALSVTQKLLEDSEGDKYLPSEVVDALQLIQNQLGADICERVSERILLNLEVGMDTIDFVQIGQFCI